MDWINAALSKSIDMSLATGEDCRINSYPKGVFTFEV